MIATPADRPAREDIMLVGAYLRGSCLADGAKTEEYAAGRRPLSGQ